MRTPTLITLGTVLLLSACGSVGTTSINQENLNPLTASRYGDELADRMANLIIQNDPILQEQGVEDLIKDQVEEGKRIGSAAREKMSKGMKGPILPMAQAVLGYALYFDDLVHLSSDFMSDPGPALHVYITTVVDPRDVAFPDATAIDLGAIQNLYGASTYKVPHQTKPEHYRTLVFYDTKLKRLYGFAQLSKGG